MSQQSRNIVYCADRQGTGIWRRIFQADILNSLSQGNGIDITTTICPILDQKYYHDMTSVTVQRWISDQHRELMCKFFKPLMDANNGWLVYEIDDNMSDQCIPQFNRGRPAFEGEKVQNNIKVMLNTADLVTVTTDYLKNFYHEHYGVPLENIVAVPNLLPKWWFGDKYNLKEKTEQRRKYQAKPRIGIVSSLSHYNIDNAMQDKNGLVTRKKKLPDGRVIYVNTDQQEVKEEDLCKITDDFDDITECVRSTVKDFQWVMFGYCPPQIKDLVEKKLIEYHPGVPLLDYALTFHQLQLQAVVSPIKKIEFNFCKSFIKTMECAALGVPLFATNCQPYCRVMDREQLFDTGDELKEKLTKLKFLSTSSYEQLIEKQWKWLNSPCVEGDFKLNNFWLEDNLSNVWNPIFKLRQKVVKISWKTFKERYKVKKEEDAKSLIQMSESGKAKVTL